MAIEPANLITWDEINCESILHTNEEGCAEIFLTRGDDTILTRELLKLEAEVTSGREINDEDFDPNDEDVWEIKNITHAPNATIVEHRSDRNHMGISTIIWLNGIT